MTSAPARIESAAPPAVDAFGELGAAAAALVGVLSVVYAVAFLIVAPSAQRGRDVAAFMRSYHDHPAGMRIASLCLAVSGVAIGAAVTALVSRLRADEPSAQLSWAQAAGVAAGLLTAAHGLGDLLSLNALADRYVTGTAATRGSVAVAHAMPSAIDPRGLMTFAVTGLAVLALACALHVRRRRLGAVGVALGVDLVLLFLATAFGVHAAVLVLGAAASLVLGPAWWLGVARLLRSPIG